MGCARLVRARVLLVALVTLCGGLIWAPGAQAYPGTVCSVTVSPRTLVGGKSITAVGTANQEIDWTFTLKATDSSPRVAAGRAIATQTFTEQVAHGHGTTFRHTFTTPKVSRTLHLTLESSCGGDTGVTVDPASGGGAGGAGGNNGGPSSHGGGGVLPNTGGPGLWIALLALVLLGGGAVTVRRQLRD